MELPLSFKYLGWTIRYNILDSTKTSGSADQTEPKCVVFVHGTPWSSVVYEPVISALLARCGYRILVYDLPGYGQSQIFNADDIVAHDESNPEIKVFRGFPGNTSVATQGAALAALLSHTKFGGDQGSGGAAPSPPAVVAHDIAGTIVLRAHLLLGVEFAHMLLAETNCVLPWGDGFYKLARDDPGAFTRLPPAIFEAVVRAVIRSACHDPAAALQSAGAGGWEDKLARPWLKGDDDEGKEDGLTAEDRQVSFVRQIAQANDLDVKEMLEEDAYAKMRCDVKIIWGEQDQWIPKNKIDDLIERMRGRVKEYAFIPNAGHLVMLDQPARFAIEVFDWLERH